MKTMLISKCGLFLSIAALALSSSAGRAVAQDPSKNPTFGSVTLKAGFLPDPHVKLLTAGGSIKTTLGGVTAHVADAPDYRLSYTKGVQKLTIRVESAIDTTLLINLPNGQWIANDDGMGRNPTITFNAPLSGRYDIFVGTYGVLSGAAKVIITEREGGLPPAPNTPMPNPPQVPAAPLPGMNPTYGAVTLLAGFLPDPFTKDVRSGGSIKTNLGGVNSHVAQAPDFRLSYTKGVQRLTIKVLSDGDTTLLINLPNGQWIANDDGGGNRNPSITFNAPLSGRYDIYVGSFTGTGAAAKLIITER